MKLVSDKYFMLPLGVAIFAAALLSYRHLISPVLSTTTSRAVQNHHVQVNQVSPQSSSYKPNTQTYTPAPAAAPAQTQHSHSYNNIPIKKVRPKSGGTNWIVGTEANADTNDLSDVLKNMEEGDTIHLGTGTFDFNFSTITTHKLHIIGDEASILKVTRSYSRMSEIEMTLEKLILTSSDDYFSISDPFKKVTMDHVVVKNSLRMSFRENVEAVIKNSFFKGVHLSFYDHVKASLENLSMTSASTLVILDGFADVEVKGGNFNTFSSIAFSSSSSFVKFKAEGAKIFNGRYAFYGKFNRTDTKLKNNDISRLYRVSEEGNNIDCSMCLIQDIERR